MSSAPPVPATPSPAMLTLADIVRALLNGKWWVLAGFVFGIGLGIAAGFKMTKMWRSQVVFAAVQPDRSLGGLGALAGQMGDLGGLLGNLNVSGAMGTNRNVNLAMLTSREFTEGFIRKHDLMPVLFWKRWDAVNKRWKVDPESVPTMSDAVMFFDRRIRQVREDKKTGLISMTIDWRDRDVAALWANQLIMELNDAIREDTIRDSNLSLQFLEKEAERVQVVELRQAIYRMMESNLKTVMAANVRRDFAFQIIDHGVRSDVDKYVRPNWMILCFLGGLFGMGCAAFLVLVRAIRRHRLPSTAS
jgi:hypothetical protein